jgi:uncharacterized RDD family membrane protein YckC
MTGFERFGIDSSVGVQTPEGIEFVLFPAGFPIRVCAWGIDCCIKGMVIFGLLVVVNILHKAIGVWLYLILNFVLDWFYHAAFEVLWNGQTPGKRVMGIRVVRSDGSPVNPGASFLRNLLRFADGFLYLYLIAFLCMSTSRGFRRFGDWAGDTLVVYTAHSRLSGRFAAPAFRNRHALPWLADVPAVVPCCGLSYEEKQGLLMFARRYPLLGKDLADEIARPWAAELRRRETDGGLSGSGTEPVSDSAYLLGIAHIISGVT